MMVFYQPDNVTDSMIFDFKKQDSSVPVTYIKYASDISIQYLRILCAECT